MKSSNLKKGFTLVELLITVSVILISVGVAGDLLISVIRSYSKTSILNEIEQNGNFILAKVTYDLKNSISYTVSPASLVLTDTNGVVTTYAVKVANSSGVIGSCTGTCINVITRRIGTGSEDIMTNYNPTDGVDITQYGSVDYFTLVTATPAVVRVAFTMKQGPDSINSLSKSYQATSNFDVSVVLRGVR